MESKHKIIFAAQDPGGFDAVAPVIKNLKKDGSFEVIVFLKNQSGDSAKKVRIKYVDANNLSPQEIEKIIGVENPDLIFTATSAGPSIEKEMIRVAKTKGIQTISIVDYWDNYKKRFGEKFEYLTDDILVVDKIMKREMRAAGIPISRMLVVGNPRFDKFSNCRMNQGDKNIIAFYSQPFSEQLSKNFNEIKIFADVVRTLEKAYPDKKVIVKFHPKEENHNKFNKIIKSTELKIKVEKKLKAEDLSRSAGLIIGINSVALFDAVLMHKRVLSYQPNKKKGKDTLMSNAHGWSTPAYNKQDLSRELENIYTKPLPRKELLEIYSKNNSTDRVVDIIKNRISSKK